MEMCPCCSGKSYTQCCYPFLDGIILPQTAEQLMRSRYTACVLRDVKYLVATTAPSSRYPALASEFEDWLNGVQWMKLTVLDVQAGTEKDRKGEVFFCAEFMTPTGPIFHRERSVFEKRNNRWYYKSAKTLSEKRF